MKKEKSELKKDNEVSAIDFERMREILQLKDKIEHLEFDINAWKQLKSVMEGEIEKLREENRKLKEDNINLISFNEHYSPDVIVKYEDRYETAYNEECIENAKLCDKMRRLEEENKKLNIKVASLEGEIKGLNSVIDKLHKEIEEQEAEGEGLFDEIDYRKREAKRLGWKPNK